MTLHRHLRRFSRDASGMSMVEAAVALPAVFLVIAGAFDFGQAYATLSQAQRGLRSATRFLATLPRAGVCDWGVLKAKKLAVYGDPEADASKATPVIPGWSTGDITLNLPTSTTCSGTATLASIKMTANVTYHAVTWRALFLPGALTMSTSHEQMWIGQ